MRHGPPGYALGRSSQQCGLPGPGGRLSAAVRPPYQTTMIHLPAPPAPDTAMAPAPGPAASQSHLRLFVPLAPLLSPALTGSATSSYLRRRVAVCLQVRRVKRCWTDVSHLLARRQRVWTRHWTTHTPTTQLTRTRTPTVRHDDARNPMGSPRLRRGTPPTAAQQRYAVPCLGAPRGAPAGRGHGPPWGFSSWGSHTSTTHTRPLAVW